MPKWGTVPPEVPRERSLIVLAPKVQVAFAALLVHPLMNDLAALAVAAGRNDIVAMINAGAAVAADLAIGNDVMLFETGRTDERQTFLFKFGREYDDGRGIVTQARSALYSWHGFFVAGDFVEKDATPWDAPPEFWRNLRKAGLECGLRHGPEWDGPHLHWHKCPIAPTEADRVLFRAEGKEAVWAKYGAD